MGVFYDNPVDREQLIEKIGPVAKRFLGKLRFAMVDVSKHKGFAKYFAVLPGRQPALVIEDLQDHKFRFDGISSQGSAIEDWVRAFWRDDVARMAASSNGTQKVIALST